MSNRTPPASTLVAVSLVVLMVVGSLGANAVADTTYTHNSTADTHYSHSDNGNYTVDVLDPEPGIDDASYKEFAVPSKSFQRMDYLVNYSPDVDYSKCTAFDARAFAIDRGNDDPGTESDDSLLDNYESAEFTQDYIVVDFLDGDDASGNSTYLNNTDQMISYTADCYGNPEEPGWYQTRGMINGTNWEGDHIEAVAWSHYFFICECANEQEAEEQLGPKPGPEPTSTPTGDKSTPTPTPTATPTSTPTATPDRGDDEEVATSTPTQDRRDDPTPTAPSAQNEEPTNQTPTLGDGPGFTGLVAVVALLACTLLVRRW